MPNYKSSYRRTKPVLSVSVKVIIVLLVVLVITLLAFLIKILVSRALEPDITYPSESETEENAAVTRDNVPEVTEAAETETAVHGIDTAKFDTKTGSLVLCNKNTSYTLPESQKLVNLYDANHENFTLANSSIRLADEAYDALCKMCNTYAERSGYCPLMITSGYRDNEEQKKFYDDYVVNESDKAYVELPGYSDHHTGYGFDVKLYDKDGASYSYGRNATERAAWIVENHKYYGFIMRYPASKGAITGIGGESNHFRYVGVPHSVYIEENNLCLEEYLALVKSRTYDDPLKITADSGEYRVWYCTGDTVFVPKDEDYTVSADNLGGFIVTVKL